MQSGHIVFLTLLLQFFNSFNLLIVLNPYCLMIMLPCINKVIQLQLLGRLKNKSNFIVKQYCQCCMDHI